MANNTFGNSRPILRQKILGDFPATRIKRFLLESANLPNPIDFPEHRKQFGRWLERWQRFFTFQSEIEVQSRRRDGSSRTSSSWRATLVPTNELKLFAPILRTTLNRLWVEKDARQREWYMYRLRDAHRQMVRHLEGWGENATWGGRSTPTRLTDYAFQEVPRASFFEVALCWLQAYQNHFRFCPNPECVAPYFLRVGRRHVYCTPACANPARKESKRRWWHKSPNSPRNRAKNKS